MIENRDLWDIIMTSRGHKPRRHGIDCHCIENIGYCEFPHGVIRLKPICEVCGKTWKNYQNPHESVPMKCEGA